MREKKWPDKFQAMAFRNQRIMHVVYPVKNYMVFIVPLALNSGSSLYRVLLRIHPIHKAARG